GRISGEEGAAGAARVPPHWHAADEPAARPVRAAATRRSPAGPQLPLICEAVLCRREDRVRLEDGRRFEHRGTDRAVARCDAPPHEESGIGPPAEAADVAGGRRTAGNR